MPDLSTSGRAAEIIQGGDFESGSFGAWSYGGEKGGYGFIAAEGSCFSEQDTTRLTLPGNFSAAIRSGWQGGKDQVGTLVSPPFVAGEGFAFQALTEASDGRRARNPASFSVRLYDADTNLQLLEFDVRTAQVSLRSGCGMYPRNAGFSTHYIATEGYRGRNLRIQFRQHTNQKGYGYFTLVDNVLLYPSGELPLIMGLPVAVAGTSTINGFLHLDASLSFDPADSELTYTWHIDDDPVPRLGRTVSIADLEDGDYRVVLYVSDGGNQVADELLLTIKGNDPESAPLPGTPQAPDDGDEEDEESDDMDDPDTASDDESF